MATTNGNRKILDLKRWEMVSPAPVATAAGSFIASSRHFRQGQLYVQATTIAYLYNPMEDGWVQLPSPALAGTLAAGASGTAAAFSTGSTIAAATLTATGGSTTTIVTNQTLARDLRGYSVQIADGPNAGSTYEIARNTIGANATITITTTAGSAFSASTVYRLVTPRWYVLGSGTLASGSFRVYDFATNTWTTLSNTGLPATIGTDGKLVATPSWMGAGYLSQDTGTATSGGTNTLTESTANWATNQWANAQVRITGGTGAGQIRTISSNTATVLTVSTNWTTAPDSTSTFSISGNDDFLYYLGNNAVAMYRYSISGNSWTTLSPAAARAAAPGAGMSAHWIYGSTDTTWTDANNIINGRRIYSFRGGGSAVLDYYDIASNTWVSGVTYSPVTETFTTGTKYVYYNDDLYIHKDATGRWFRYSFPRNEMVGVTTNLFPGGAALVGDTAFDIQYTDGATTIEYVYMLLNTSTVMMRMMVI